MRLGVSLLVVFVLSGCSAMVMGGGSAGQGGRTASVATSDSAITSTINGQLRSDASLGDSKIDVQTYKGTVTLSGIAENHTARDRAGSIAKGVKGVVAVNNLIAIERQVISN